MVRYCTILLILVFFCVLCVYGEQRHSKEKHYGQVGKGKPGKGDHGGKGNPHHGGQPKKHHIRKKPPHIGPPKPKKKFKKLLIKMHPRRVQDKKHIPPHHKKLSKFNTEKPSATTQKPEMPQSTTPTEKPQTTTHSLHTTSSKTEPPYVVTTTPTAIQGTTYQTIIIVAGEPDAAADEPAINILEEVPTEEVHKLVEHHLAGIKNQSNLEADTAEEKELLASATVQALSFYKYIESGKDIYLIKVEIGGQAVIHVKISGTKKGDDVDVDTSKLEKVVSNIQDETVKLTLDEFY